MDGTWRFEPFTSLPFWVALAGAAALVRLGGARPALRSSLLLACSCAILLAAPRFGPVELLLVLLLGAGVLGGARSLAASPAAPPARRRAVAAAGILGVLAFLAVFKFHLPARLGAGQAGLLELPLVLLGVSYFSFKAIHLLVEAYRGKLPPVAPLTVLNYLLFFPAFVSGPIHRYPEFAAQLEAAGPPGALAADLRAGGERIVHGLFKKLVLVPLLAPHLLVAPGRPLAEATAGGAALGLYATAVYLYLDFAGYSDLAIGASRLLGLRLPENFDRPFLQRNLRDLWSCWHMTLTSWLVEYVYWPLARRLRGVAWLRPRPVLLSSLAMLATFLACGLWHGEAPHFLAWGAWHGLGLAVVAVYQRQKRRIPVAALQRWFASPASRAAGALATFHWFAAGLALFVLDLEELGTLLTALRR